MEEDNALAQDKVLILYTLDSIKKDITSSDLFKIISSINDMNYFYFRQILADLVDSKLVGTYNKDEQNVFEITNDGKTSLSLTLDVLPGLVKLKADNLLKKELAIIAEESSISAEYIPESEHSFTVKCKIREDNKTVFEIKTFAGSKESAKKISDNWQKNASTIYPEILNLLIKDKNV